MYGIHYLGVFGRVFVKNLQPEMVYHRLDAEYSLKKLFPQISSTWVNQG